MDPVPDPPDFVSKSVPDSDSVDFLCTNCVVPGIAADGNKCKFYRCILSGQEVILDERHRHPNWTSCLILSLGENSERIDLRFEA